MPSTHGVPRVPGGTGRGRQRRARPAGARRSRPLRSPSARALDVADGHEDSGVAGDLLDGRHRGRDHRDAGRHRLEDREPEALVHRGIGDDPGRGVQVAQLGAGSSAQPGHEIRVAASRPSACLERVRTPSRRVRRARAGSRGRSAASRSMARSSDGRSLRGSIVPTASTKSSVPASVRPRTASPPAIGVNPSGTSPPGQGRVPGHRPPRPGSLRCWCAPRRPRRPRAG